MSTPYIIQVVGYSKSGKTTLIEELVKQFQMKEISSFTLKSARTHSYEYTMKDSDRFLNSGAQASAVIFNDLTQISIKSKLDVNSIIDEVVRISDCSIVLIEGFKELTYPKILVWGEEIPKSSEIDYTTIRYLYYPKELKFDQYKTLDELIKQEKIILIKNIEELISNIVNDLESR
ncbi:MAG: molybdopterin-guanine dinucleotide biosynthesis protein B [Candidatus Heimdallarchaeaceae archaeon]